MNGSQLAKPRSTYSSGGETVTISDEAFRQCGEIVAPPGGPWKIRSDPQHRILKDGIYVVSHPLKGKWVLSLYRNDCLGANEVEIAVDPLAMTGNDLEKHADARAWLDHQKALLENEPARPRIFDRRINAYMLGFTLSGASVFLERLALEADRPGPQWQINAATGAEPGEATPGSQEEKWRRRAAIVHMLAMAHQAAAASGSETVRVSKHKEVRFASSEHFQAHLEGLLRNPVCAISQLPLDLTFQDKELSPSLDRKDANGHYEEGNLQVVARFINRWKSDDDMDNFNRLLSLVRQSP
jgi:hypothetical protein